jgi:DNA-binding NarL/FixJ family response regulator
VTVYKVVLADDHQFLLEGISAVLKELPSIEIVATAQNGKKLMDDVAREKPDLVILDLNMPGYDGLQCLQRIKKGYPAIKVLILTNYNQPELVEEVQKMGADGFLVKNASSVELKEAIQSVIEGRSFYPAPSSISSLQEDSYFFDDFLKKYQLTRREVEIIKLVCREMSTKEIAASLFLSDLTVNTHRRNILRKLDVKNVAGLVNFAKEHMLL